MRHDVRVRPILPLIRVVRLTVIACVAIASLAWLVSSTLAVAQTPTDGDAGVPDAGTGANPDAAPDAAQSTPTAADLRPPATPAFTLLGIAPTEIENPRTPKELAVVLGGAVGTEVPTSLAISMSPYWLFRHDELNANEYEKEWYLHWLRTATVSLAATERAADAADPMSTNTALMSWAVNTLLYKGKPAFPCPPGSDELFTQTLDMVKERQKAFAEWAPTLLALMQAYRLQNPGLTDEEYAKHDKELIAEKQAELNSPEYVAKVWSNRLEELTPSYEQRAVELKVCAEAQLTPRGFSLGAASGGVVSFANEEWKQASDKTYAAWLSPAYQHTHFSAALLARLTVDVSGAEAANLWDVGGRATYVGKRVHLSLEHVRRFGDVDADGTSDRTWRLAALVEAKVKDSWVVLGIGKDYDSASGEKFFAIANLQFDVGEAQITSTEIKALKDKFDEERKKAQEAVKKAAEEAAAAQQSPQPPIIR